MTGPDRPEGDPARAERDRDRDRTLAAVHRLEEALAAPGPGRTESWRSEVAAALEELEAATRDEEANAARPDSLLSDIARNQPRLRHRVHGLRTQYAHVRDTIAQLRAELAVDDSETDIADVRHRLAWPLTALRHQRARESDLMYEALAGGDDTERRP
jgi:hypothetical protein